MTETVFRGGRVVLPDCVSGDDVVVGNGLIAGLEPCGHGAAGVVDLEGDWLLPGLVELHTDHLETHYSPRPKIRWNPVAAVLAHDAQIASSGITTVFDALRVGTDEDSTLEVVDSLVLARAISESLEGGRLRADHFLHLRCEVSAADVLDGFGQLEGEPRARLVSLMDHTPGQRQFVSLDAFRTYYRGKTGKSETELDELIARRQRNGPAAAAKHRAVLADAALARGMTLASHDDATPAHVDEAVANGVTLAEFPTTVEAAEASRSASLRVVMGAPNVVRGGSHSGNISAMRLAERHLLDILSSDYFPSSLLHATFLIAEGVAGVDMPRAVAMVSRNPADAVGLNDRGAIEAGRRADLVRVRAEGGIPVVRGVWRQGVRVA